MARYVNPVLQLVNDDASGVAAGWQLSFFESGTSTPKNTYSDDGLTTANPNPVVADSAGRFGNIFLEAGSYKVTLTDENDVEKWTADPVEGPIGSSGAVDDIDGDYTITLGDATKVLAVDATSAAVTITLLPAATATDGYEITIVKVDNSTNAVTIDADGTETIDDATTVVLTNQYQGVTIRSDGAEWRRTAVNYRTLSLEKGADVASAAALTLGAGNYFDITGTTAITSIGTRGVGTVVKLHFDGALTLTHHATDLILPGSADITTAAGDEAEFVEYASGDWICTNYQIAAKRPSAGRVVQVVNVQDGVADTGTTAIPADDTIPQNTEGDEYMTLAITPTSATNVLYIDVVANLSHSTANVRMAVALFQDDTANALAASSSNIVANDAGVTISFRHKMTAGTTSETTFKVRAGGNTGSSTTFNGTALNGLYGGTTASSITITEVQA